MPIVKTGLSFLTAALLATSTTLALAQTCNHNIPLTKPDSRYNYNPAGDEVTDTVTGLIWKRCAEGMSWSGSTCTGTATSFTWEGALELAASVAQTTGVPWRMPNIKELRSLVETACAGPSINQAAFPATSYNAWSCSLFAANSDDAWNVSFYNEYYDGIRYKGNYSRVRLVRSQ